ncbi:formylglycine-generating enzyme family protein [Planococcus lenghuensis]|uniref:Serine/threonine protein phosphatase n=1 Tax=Planococcus lenghuensis TaxID=2213202 RepID=A0A1Q2L446_9BACL|nr:formylglycine-generating enzyme family protein [Planococcus lenghuensis]AQQ55209.1 serine/threonine protein phosphatase [Planococcus lenghuensis]
MKSCCSASRSQISSKDIIKIERIAAASEEKSIRFYEKMIFIEGGEFLMGTNDQEGVEADCEGPVKKERVNSFYMDSHVVTNEEFRQFIQETGYRTEAEGFGWSFVFYQFISPSLNAVMQQVTGTPWWFAVEGAYWFQPEGPGSTIENRMDHPVIHVSWNDAMAFCNWAGKRLPTEKEWEFAARGGLEQTKYPWGNELIPEDKHHCNIWQGKFPTANTMEDGYAGTAPARSFPPNGYGLYNMAGNVWEWCTNAFTPSPEAVLPAGQEPNRAMRGGSYLCHESYCNRYRVAARTSNTIDSSAGNIGFRCISDQLL